MGVPECSVPLLRARRTAIEMLGHESPTPVLWTLGLGEIHFGSVYHLPAATEEHMHKLPGRALPREQAPSTCARSMRALLGPRARMPQPHREYPLYMCRFFDADGCMLLAEHEIARAPDGARLLNSFFQLRKNDEHELSNLLERALAQPPRLPHGAQ